MLDEYAEKKNYVENKKPYWLYLDAQDELKWDLFNYFPEAHYTKAISEAFEQEAKDDVLSDGGTIQYPWNDEKE